MDLTNLNKDRKDRRKPNPMEFGNGKVPPQSKELEVAILGAVMLDKRGFDIVNELLTPQTFYLDAHQKIFSAMRGLSQKNSPIDILTVVEELRFREELDLVGGPFYVTKLTNGVQSAANIEAHARIILQNFLKREVIRVGSEMVANGYEDSIDVFDLLDDVETNVYGLTQTYIKNDFSHISKGLVKAVKRIEQLRAQDETVTGVPSGFEQLDKTTHGWQPQDLIIVAARPSTGKSAFALNLARNAAMNPHKSTPVGFFSLEMSEDQLIRRLLSAETNIWMERFATGKFEEAHMKTLYKKGVEPLSSSPIYLDDTAALTMFELRAKARRMIDKHKVGLIIIDYLQLMSGDRSQKNVTREQEVSRLSRDLKKLGKELKIPVIALSQLSRDIEKRGKGQKQPQLSDLRESGAIEQDADLVIFLYRPPPDEVAEDAELANIGNVRIAKHRNGSLINLSFEVDNSVQQWKEVGVVGSVSTNYKPVAQANKEQERLYIQKGSQMSNYDDLDEAPF